MTKRNMLSGPTIVLVGNLLEKHVTKIGEGLCAYEEGYDDARIAQMATTVAHPVNSNNVANLRKDMFGTFPRGISSEVSGNITTRLAALEARARELENRLMAIESRYDNPVLPLVGKCHEMPRDPLGDENFPTAKGDPRAIRFK